MFVNEVKKDPVKLLIDYILEKFLIKNNEDTSLFLTAQFITYLGICGTFSKLVEKYVPIDTSSEIPIDTSSEIVLHTFFENNLKALDNVLLIKIEKQAKKVHESHGKTREKYQKRLDAMRKTQNNTKNIIVKNLKQLFTNMVNYQHNNNNKELLLSVNDPNTSQSELIQHFFPQLSPSKEVGYRKLIEPKSAVTQCLNAIGRWTEAGNNICYI
jgi:hypothetical protein